jgi:hypothetical protein
MNMSAEKDQKYQNRHGGDRGKQMTWTDCKDFKDTVGPIELVVRVSKTDEYVPKYSIKMGRFRPDGNIVGSNIPIYARGRGKIDIARVGVVLAKLVKDAEDWVHNEAQIREDEIIDDKVRREEKGTKKYEQPKGLGALGKMDAVKRQVQALQARVAETLSASPVVAVAETVEPK